MQNDVPDSCIAEPSGKSFLKTVNIEPYRKISNNKALMDILLYDRNTKSNLIWATNDYESQGCGFGPRDTIQYLFIVNPDKIIRPRYLKSHSEQKTRSRDMAEVFTPPWIVNKQNNLIDEQWTGRKDVFNIENGKNWIPTEHADLGDRNWKEYVTSVRMEVCCGEGPYITTRYNAIDGTAIQVQNRVGMLDRKFRIVSENINTELNWLEWAKAAVKSIYGYDFQGDNVLLTRENILLAFIESFKNKFNKDLPDTEMKEICQILSWNIWQMDGTKMVVPFSCEKMCCLNEEQSFINNCPACKNGKGRHSGRYCQIKDWETDASVEFASLIGKQKSPKAKVANTRTLESFW